MKIPKYAQGPITLAAKLNYRKFSYYYTQFAYAANPSGAGSSPSQRALQQSRVLVRPEQHPENCLGAGSRIASPISPRRCLPKRVSRFRSADGKAPTVWTPVVKKADRERWNDWGNRPPASGRSQGPRVRVQAGHGRGARLRGRLGERRARAHPGGRDRRGQAVCRAGAQVGSTLDRIYYRQALIQKADGDYEGAVQSLEIVEAKYPRDRVVLNQIGRVLSPPGEVREALEALERVSSSTPKICKCTTQRCCVTGAWAASRRRRGKEALPALQDRGVVAGRHRPQTPAEPGRKQRAPVDSRARERAVADRPSWWAAGRRRAPSRRVATDAPYSDSGAVATLGAAAALNAAVPPVSVTFTDVTVAAGVKFVHNSGRAGKKSLPETLGSGEARSWTSTATAVSTYCLSIARTGSRKAASRRARFIAATATAPSPTSPPKRPRHRNVRDGRRSWRLR